MDKLIKHKMSYEIKLIFAMLNIELLRYKLMNSNKNNLNKKIENYMLTILLNLVGRM